MSGEDLIETLADFDQSGTQDTNVISEAIERSDSKIDAWLGKRFVVPFDTVPEMISIISDHLTAYDLISQRHPDSEEAKFHLAEAMMYLEKLATGEMYLDSPTITSGTGSTSLMVPSDLPDPVFVGVDDDDVDRMSGW
jgi:phage gp36-like protein